MQVGTVLDPLRFRASLTRGDGFSYRFGVNLNSSAGDCSPVTQGDPFSLAGYLLSVEAIALGTNEPVTARVRLDAEGSSTARAEFSVVIGSGPLGKAFAEGALQTVQVRVGAQLVDEEFTLLDGLITLEDSASRVGAPAA